jgi:hypothetical protein
MTLSVLFSRPRGKLAQNDGFEIEWAAMSHLEVESHVIDIEHIVDGDADVACEDLPRRKTWLYRGYILTQEEYEALYEAVGDRGGRLVVDPQEYANALYVPEWYPTIKDVTPLTRWTHGADIDEVWEAAQELGAGPWIVKDHVKSARDDWKEACFVPKNATREDLAAIVEALVDARGERFERGIVIRKFMKLAELREYQHSPDRPVCDEHRIFFFEGEPIAQAPYNDVDADPINLDEVRFLGKRIDSPFFTADIARTSEKTQSKNGLTVVEVNDGGVSTLPVQLDPRDLYEAIIDRLE